MLVDLRMAERFVRLVRKQVLLRHVSDVFAIRILGEKVVVGLVFGRPDFLGDRQPPFFCIVEHRVDVEDHPAKRENAVLDDLPDSELGESRSIHMPFSPVAPSVTWTWPPADVNCAADSWGARPCRFSRVRVLDAAAQSKVPAVVWKADGGANSCDCRSASNAATVARRAPAS